MVRTRQRAGEEDENPYVCVCASTSRKSQLRNSANGAPDSDDFECTPPTRKRRRKHNSSTNTSSSSPKAKFSNSSLGPTADVNISKSPIPHRPVTRLAYRRCAQRSKDVTNHLGPKDDKVERTVRRHYSEHSYINGDSDMHSNVRRSTRQRKFIYDNLNQRWLLASNIHDFGKFDFISDNKTSVNNEGDILHKNADKAQNGELRRLGLANPELEFEDMYSRVKRERRKAVRDYYSQTHETGNMADTEETDHNESTDEEQATETGTVGSGDESHEDVNRHTKYSLRPKKPVTDRFQFPIEQFKPKRVGNIFHASTPSHHQRKEHPIFKSPAHRTPLYKRKRHAIHNSSSTSSSSDDERRFERRKAKSMARARNRCLPMNLTEEDLSKGVIKDRNRIGSSLADIDPMSVDKSVAFDHIGGLDHHIDALKEMVLFPLMYPEVFEKFKIAPPRGVLFYGPPGTGKTLVARALANECSQGNRKVAFFMRKGADCLSKWVGESERQLRLLFDQAHSMRPSIIFFDEIDGLAPVRSTRQDQIHSSIVSTLLALMDGLDDRGEIVVIGATNRIDAIDAALRRPGRFDREFLFPLPTLEARHSILQIHTRMWQPPLHPKLLQNLAVKSVGYCGADLKALCSETALIALRRRYPQIYSSQQKLQLDVNSIEIKSADFADAMMKIVPASQRSVSSPARPLSPIVRPLLEGVLLQTLKLLQTIFPAGIKKSLSANSTGLRSSVPENSQNSCDSDYISSDDEMSDSGTGQERQDMNEPNGVDGMGLKFRRNCFFSKPRWMLSHRPRLLLAGQKDQGQNTHLAPALIHCLEPVSLHRLDLPSLYAVTTKAPEEACAQVFSEARRCLPSILYLPHIGHWWCTLNDTVRATFLTLLDDMEPSAPLLLLATSDRPYHELSSEVQDLFNTYHGEVVEMRNPKEKERREFFGGLFLKDTVKPPKSNKRKIQELEELPLAPTPLPRQLSDIEIMQLRQQEESTLRELRLFLRDILNKLARDRRFSMFAKPVDPEEVPDYLEVIKNPIDLETMMTKIDLHQYETAQQFLEDIDLICHNALEYNPDRDPTDKLIRHRACTLKDTAHALVNTELDEEFEKICEDIHRARLERGESPTKFAPHNYRVLRKPNHQIAEQGDPKSSVEKEGQPYPTRFSRRLRGMGTTPPSSENDTSRKEPNTMLSSDNPYRQTRQRRWSMRFSRNNSGEVSKDKVDRAESVGQPEPFGTKPVDQCHNASFDSEPVRNAKPSSRSSNNTNHSDNHTRTSFDSMLTDDSETSSENKNCRLSQRRCVPSRASCDLSSCAELPICDKDATSRLSSHCDDRFRPLPSSSVHKTRKVSEDSQKHDSTHVIAQNIVGNEEGDSEGRSEEKHVIVDREKARSLLEQAITVTDGCSVGTLERFYCSLQRCVHKHRKEWDKGRLLMELQGELEKFRRYHNEGPLFP